MRVMLLLPIVSNFLGELGNLLFEFTVIAHRAKEFFAALVFCVVAIASFTSVGHGAVSVFADLKIRQQIVAVSVDSKNQHPRA